MLVHLVHLIFLLLMGVAEPAGTLLTIFLLSCLPLEFLPVVGVGAMLRM